MKNGLLIWNAVLTVLAGYLLFTHFNSRKNTSSEIKHSSKDSSYSHSLFRVAYFEMDSVENNFQMVKDVQAEISQREKEYDNDVAKLDWAYKNKYEGYQQKASSMSKDDFEKAKVDLKQLEDQLKVQKQEFDQQYQDYVMRRKLSLKTTIADFLKKYNESKNYSYIMVYERDLFYYKDTAYNITNDLIKGLNDWYKEQKK